VWVARPGCGRTIGPTASDTWSPFPKTVELGIETYVDIRDDWLELFQWLEYIKANPIPPIALFGENKSKPGILPSQSLASSS
jgi:hypothetical protein